jgi:hypothetical protein
LKFTIGIKLRQDDHFFYDILSLPQEKTESISKIR